jgi:hypothetical protein
MQNLSNLPNLLKDTPQWILWKMTVKNGKPTKVPCLADGTPVSVKEQTSWHPFEDAVALHHANRAILAGVGFCFTEDDPFFGIDLDACLPNLGGDAQEILRRFATYAEVSPSGTGIKLIGLGRKADDARSNTTDVDGFYKLEVYDRDRFFTITGQQWGFDLDIEPQQDELDWLMAKFLPDAAPPVVISRTVEGASSLLERASGFEGTDDELIDYLREDAAYNDLWLGDMSAYRDDHSAADAALLEKIAWLVGPVPERIERIFDGSELANRDKWNRQDYRDRSIAFALADKTDFYSGSGGGATLDAVDYPTPSDPEPNALEPTLSFPIPESGIIRDVVDLVGPLTESPDSTLALGTLIMLSAVAGWGRVSKWGESEEPCILYACICGPSASGRKTTGLRTVESIFHEAIDPDDLQLESVGHASGRALLEIAIGGVDIFYVKVKEPKGPQTIEVEGEIIPSPEWVEYDDLLARRKEKLENPPSVVLIWDEMAKLLSVDGDWQRDTRTELLRMYNGKHSGIRTSGKEGLKVPGGKVQMAFLGTMVTADLERGLNSAQANDGLMGRILFSPDSRDEKPHLAFPPEPGIDYERRKMAIKTKLDRFRFRCETRVSVFDYWTPEARAARERWYHERKDSTGVALMLFDRVQATAAKIACLLSLAEDAEFIEEHHVVLAQQMADTSIQVSMAAVEAAVEAQRDRYLDSLVERIEKLGSIPMSKVWEFGLLGVKEPGERMPERSLRELWISKDPRIVVEPPPQGGGHRLRLVDDS